LLGPAGRGELAVIIFLPMLLVPLGELELPRSLAYEVSRLEDVPRSVIATSFWLAAGLGLLQALLLAALLPLYLPTDKLHLLGASRWFMIYLPAALISATLMGSDQGRGRFGRFSVLLALPGALYVAAILPAWASGQIAPSTFAIGLLVATLLTTTLRVSMDRESILFSRPDWVLARRLLKRGFSYYLPAIGGFLLARADMFIVVRLVPMSAVGLYVVAQAIALGQIGAVLPFVHVGFAAVAGEADPQQALHTLARHFRLAQLVTISVGLLAAAATPWIVRIMFGPRFMGAMTATYLLIGATVLWGMSQVLEQGLRAASHPQAGIISNLLGLTIMFGIGIPACLGFGINGVAASLLAAQFLNLGVLVAFCVVRLKMLPRQFWALDSGSLKELRSSGASFMDQACARTRRFVFGARP
jgi:O-antigen/teichoic acid export membrane protein